MSTIRDFRLKIDQERRALVKLENRALEMQDRVFKQRGLVLKMESHYKDWQKSLGGEHGTGNT